VADGLFEVQFKENKPNDIDGKGEAIIKLIRGILCYEAPEQPMLVSDHGWFQFTSKLG
jgi:hypothetical protein